MTNTQKYSYHTHNNSLGIFDGQSSAEEMISKAEDLGFEEIGVSNHLCVHPHIPNRAHKMFLNDPAKALDIYKKMYDELEEVASRHKIKVYKGFEVDFFPSKTWRNWFEKIIKELNYDYLIGASHFIRSPDEKFMCNIYHLKDLPLGTPKEVVDEYLLGYWDSIYQAVASGYFDFMAHIDYCSVSGLCMSPKWDDIKWKLVEIISAHKQPFEINTGGLDKIGRPFPEWKICDELIKRNIPVVISCDSHHVSQIGRHFDEVEKYLAEKGCKHRFKISK